LFPRIKSCDQNRGGDGLYRNGHVALVGDQTSSILTDLNTGFNSNNYLTKFYSSETSLNDYITSSSYKEDVCLGVNIV
jgi:hypothetical protein